MLQAADYGLVIALEVYWTTAAFDIVNHKVSISPLERVWLGLFHISHTLFSITAVELTHKECVKKLIAIEKINTHS